MGETMSTPPEENPDAPSSGSQMAADGKEAAAAIAKGAITGGAVGALKGAATAAIKTQTGRKGILIAAGTPLAIIVVICTVIGSILGGTPGQVKIALDASHAFQADTVALKQSEDRESLNVLQAVADRTSVRWEVLAAIWQRSTKKSIDKGAGPMGIDMGQVKDGGITAEDAVKLEPAAEYIARKLSEASSDTLYRLPNHDLDAGYAVISYEEGKEPVRLEMPGDEAKKLRQDVFDQYVAAIKQLPIKGNPDIAKQIMDLAAAWAQGKEGPNDAGNVCSADSSGGDVKLGGTTSADLNDTQLKHVQRIINRVAERGMSEQAAVIALITAYVESKFRMYWNIKVPGSKELTEEKDAVGSDGYSVGLFQQQVNGTMYSWGAVEDAMNPQKSTDMFLDRLMKIPGWDKMLPGDAAQKVQVSAHPGRYQEQVPLAKQLVNDLKPTNGGFSEEEEHAPEPSGKAGNKFNLKVGSHSALTANTRAVEQAVVDKFSDKVSAMGDYRTDGEHGQGRAVDLMIHNYASPAGVAAGDAISQFFIDNQPVFNVEYLIFNDRIWLGDGQGWKKYSGNFGKMYDGNWNDTTLHKDHVHITTGYDPGTGGEYVYKSPDGNSSICGGNTGIGTGTAGNGDDYPWRDPVTFSSEADPWGLFKRQCVSFVAWRINQQMGWKEGEEYPFTMAKMGMSGQGNALQWKAGLERRGYITDKNPTPGSIAWWDAYVTAPNLVTGEYGHVGIVRGVNPDGTVKIEQYNAYPKPYGYTVVDMDPKFVTGFIHVADIKADTAAAAKN